MNIPYEFKHEDRFPGMPEIVIDGPVLRFGPNGNLIWVPTNPPAPKPEDYVKIR